MIEVRRARPDEGEELGSRHHAWRVAAIPSIPPPVHTESDTRTWFATQVLPNSEVWVAEVGGRVVALMVLRDDWLDHLYVAPDRTRQGVGALLIALAKERRPAGIQLWTFQSNHGARRFYEREGFEAVEETDGVGNEERAPDVRYRWTPPA